MVWMYTNKRTSLGNMVHVPRLVGDPKSIHTSQMSYNTVYTTEFVEHRMLDQLNAFD
jgi:hypothetical protein